MDTAEAREFLSSNHRAVLITRRRDGGLQSSLVGAGIDDEGRVIVSSRETAYKTKNLLRDPQVTVCAFTEKWYGPWVQVEGRAEIVHQPDAMELLVDYYRRLAGEHPDWDEYREAMKKEKRVLIRFAIERAGPTSSG